MASFKLWKRQNPGELYVTVEYHPKLSWKILKDRNFISDQSTLTQRWWQIAGLVSIPNEKDYLPFWTEHSAEISMKLLLPIKTDYVAFPSSYLNTSSGNAERKSPCLINKTTHPPTPNVWKQCSPSCISTLAERWESADTGQSSEDTDKIDGVLKLRILPTKKQKAVLARWLGARNYTWNRALDAVEKKQVPCSFLSLKNKFAVDSVDSYMGTVPNPDVPDWLTTTPSKIRHCAIRELCDSYKTCFTKLKKRQIRHFSMGKKKKKDQRRTWTLSIPKEGIKFVPNPLAQDNLIDKRHITIYPTQMLKAMDTTITRTTKRCLTSWEKGFKKILSIADWKKYLDSKTKPPKPHKKGSRGNDCLKTTLKLKAKKKDKKLDGLTFDFDCKICYKYGHYYLHVPYKKKTSPDTNLQDERKGRVVALDPGFKTFLTYYSPSESGKIQQSDRFRTLRERLDQLYKTRYPQGGSTHCFRWSYKKFKYKTNTIYRKIHHLSREMHYQAINFLVKNYEYVLLPSFKTHEMVKGRYLARETKREAQNLSHYTFKNRLLTKCKQINHQCKTIVVSEAYTSKTCGCCGELNHDLKLSDRDFFCYVGCLGDEMIDRDIHASRNILIRNL
jgi:hypothetical protein